MSDTDERAHLDRCKLFMQEFVTDSHLKLFMVIGFRDALNIPFNEAEQAVTKLMVSYPAVFDDRKLVVHYPHIDFWRDIASDIDAFPREALPTDEDLGKLRAEWLKSKNLI